MNSKILKWVDRTKELLPDNLGRVLELGSLDVNGSVRSSYQNCEEYIGIDLVEGESVDEVMDAHDIFHNFGENSFDVIINMSMFEHDTAFWITLKNINLVLKKGGYHIFCVPGFYFPVHNYPSDYWRMSPEAVKEVIFKAYEILAFEEIYTKDQEGKKINPCICAIGRKL